MWQCCVMLQAGFASICIRTTDFNGKTKAKTKNPRRLIPLVSLKKTFFSKPLS